MPQDRFMIAPLNSGLVNATRPWLIPDDAFAQLNNAFVYRGRVRKRFGSFLMTGAIAPTVGFEQLVSRLRINLGALRVGTVPGSLPWTIGLLFSIGDEIYTVYNPALGPQPMYDTGATATKTFDLATGNFNFVGAPAGDLFFYPALPVMGLITYSVGQINDEPLFAFDTEFAYQYISGGWDRLGTAIWTGSNSQFFWGSTWRGLNNNDNLLFVSNFNPADNIKYWDGAVWTTFTPAVNGTTTITTARIIVPFQDRLLFLNTYENGVQFFNRCRFSQNGSPIDVNAWREDIPGRGGYIDAPVKQQIITAEFLKDHLIVYFESSTWELVYTGNQILPFQWFQINTELGAESTFSVVPFDREVLGIGQVGIHSCSGSNVQRIDQKIPQEVFDIHNENDGPARVVGIRDYFFEQVYWTFPSAQGVQESEDDVFPNRVLVYNYTTGSYAFNFDSITTFGYFALQNDVTWQSTNKAWFQYVDTWDSGDLELQFRSVIAGNQEGFIFIISGNESSNASALSITNITFPGSVATFTVINHNLNNDDFILITNAQGITAFNDQIFQVTVVDVNNFTIVTPVNAGTYTGGGTIARVSRIDILTKQYNFYADKGMNAAFSKIDFLVDKTDIGQVTIDTYVSTSTESMLQDGIANGAILGNGVLETSPYALYPLEATQSRLWHPQYIQGVGEVIQLRIYLSDDQMVLSVPDEEGNPDFVALQDFELHAMTFYATPAGRLQ